MSCNNGRGLRRQKLIVVAFRGRTGYTYKKDKKSSVYEMRFDNPEICAIKVLITESKIP